MTGAGFIAFEKVQLEVIWVKVSNISPRPPVWIAEHDRHLMRTSWYTVFRITVPVCGESVSQSMNCRYALYNKNPSDIQVLPLLKNVTVFFSIMFKWSLSSLVKQWIVAYFTQSYHRNRRLVDPTVYVVNWCVSRWNGRDTMDVINFFPITSWRINTWKGVNQLKELFFLNLIIIF